MYPTSTQFKHYAIKICKHEVLKQWSLTSKLASQGDLKKLQCESVKRLNHEKITVSLVPNLCCNMFFFQVKAG